MERGVAVLEVVDLAVGPNRRVQASTTIGVNVELGRWRRERRFAKLKE